jgi:hypothetical protein
MLAVAYQDVPSAGGRPLELTQLMRIRLERAATDEGFGIPRGEFDGWLGFDTLAAPTALRLTAANGYYGVATNHVGAAADLRTQCAPWPADAVPPPAGFVAFKAVDTAALHDLVRSIWRLARSLPQAPLREFEAVTQAMPRSTEAERLVVQRVGQDIYRAALLEYWQGRCAITGLAVPELLRASHAKPWKDCADDAERLDVYNGLLLAAHLDAAFDAGLIALAEDGQVIVSALLNDLACAILGVDRELKVDRIAPAHARYLKWHREKQFKP